MRSDCAIHLVKILHQRDDVNYFRKKDAIKGLLDAMC